MLIGGQRVEPCAFLFQKACASVNQGTWFDANFMYEKKTFQSFYRLP